MKSLFSTAALIVTLFSGSLFAADQQIPWADNSGNTESNHIAAMGEDLNASHQEVTKTQEGVWGTNSGSISVDEADLSSSKPPVVAHPELMPHQG
ncbi:hypothetical protein [Atlantibacter hermannii]|uniref:Secreted protein n=1 Tax=Atlantibacter hermannii NBRC 105704 TaxID=1115512 RepID=H5V495_ATLHE|nr:hypothetical protein [Atlantibacter hermannii]MDU7814926.1 hypothetical protein [Atlantibacter hermannii]QPS91124.1 hypothetical protein I6G45_16575 [Atlantibacter hermannii]GAB52803.1 hypothetical protein EH105704_09_00280 [Atlantibacter hermannii NBRC 105704]VDZ71834.1 Uncharacterised protein [Atlantibacter hermannii]